MIYNSNPDGNLVFHILNNPANPKKEIANLPVVWTDKPLIQRLMQTENIAMHRVDAPDDSIYLFVFDGNSARPLPAVMILRVIADRKDYRIVDVGQDDLQAVHFAVENYF